MKYKFICTFFFLAQWLPLVKSLVTFTSRFLFNVAITYSKSMLKEGNIKKAYI
jgi:hypothetical protein